jgi:hypothetical protein
VRPKSRGRLLLAAIASPAPTRSGTARLGQRRYTVNGECKFVAAAVEDIAGVVGSAQIVFHFQRVQCEQETQGHWDSVAAVLAADSCWRKLKTEGGELVDGERCVVRVSRVEDGVLVVETGCNFSLRCVIQLLLRLCCSLLPLFGLTL